MIVTLAFSNESNYLFDIDAALKAKKATKFDLEIINATAAGSVSGTPLQSQLLDGTKWELPVKTRKKQQIQTHANLLLAGQKVKNTFYPYKDLIHSWWFAKARWIKTDDLTTTDNRYGLVKVVRGSEELAFEEVEGIAWAQRVVLDFETAGVYSTSIV